ncbi:hypothetical protein BGZ95_003189 [Linnemannia exigua]|uniref:F-box domain-containing protein n=1 Tax=Linnemannia exigua TaxID=604196 RepID=A0AAD4D502_9FUNG|nr:hypothetical protein BGZ95_003189 [Linnemannia exigua]
MGVCKEWRAMNQHRAYRQFEWDFGWQKSSIDESLKKLSNTGRLVWGYVAPDDGNDTERIDDHQALGQFYGAEEQAYWTSPINSWSSNMASNNNNNNKRTRPVISMALREMELNGYYNIHASRHGNIPFPPTVTSIKLRCSKQCTFDISRILDACPLLETLHLEKHFWLTYHVPLRDRLPLRSLVLRFAHLSQDWFHRLLKSAPLLQDLMLIDLIQISGRGWDTARLFQHLGSLPQPLRTFHFSIQNTLPSDEELERMVMICPEAQHRTLWSYNLTPAVIRILRDEQTVLTTLDILWPEISNCCGNGWLLDREGDYLFYSSQTLHRILCVMPSLRHLRTLKAPYIIENMDIHHRTTMTQHGPSLRDDAYREHWILFQAGIWMCRNLETLHLQVHGHGRYPSEASTRTRVLYGYISTVCPQLVELSLDSMVMCTNDVNTHTETYFTADLSSGLCLLSRLKFLKHLSVTIGGHGKYDPATLNWLCVSGRTAEYRKQRRVIVDGWEAELQIEKQLEAERFIALDGASQLLVGSGSESGVDEALMERLQDLGLLRDVKNSVLEMDLDGYDCLPYLRRLSCGETLAQSPQEEVRLRTRQTVMAQLREKWWWR